MPQIGAFSLNYFDNDYKPITVGATALGLSYPHQAGDVGGQVLFNGNISSSTLAFNNLNSGAPVGYAYHYDQLNRLLHMQQHVLSGSGTTWNATQAVKAYEEQIKYDGNGNILFFNRNGSHATTANVVESQADMDRLSYIYPRDNNGQLTANRLRHIQDGVSGSNYANKDLLNQAVDNYHYDNIGNLTADAANGVSQIQWTVYGKISRITKTNGDVLKYTYDATGNRIYKEYTSGGVTNRTWYVRDAQGNTLAVYGNKNGDSQVYWNEQDLYGSSRLGTWQPGITLTAGAGATAWNQEGLTRYELTNHLGNVLSTISDQRVEVDNDHNGTIDYFLPGIVSYSDYTPFGMQMVDRSGSTGSYRYGFNGQEKSTEIDQNGNSMTAEFWQYDARIGRRWNLDPVVKPWGSPYSTFANNPIGNIDPNGADTINFTRNTTRQKFSISSAARNGGNTGAAVNRTPADKITTTGSIDIVAAKGLDVFRLTDNTTIVDEDGNSTTTSTTTTLDIRGERSDYRNGGHNVKGFVDDRYALASIAPTSLLNSYAAKNKGFDSPTEWGLGAAKAYQSDVPFSAALQKITNYAYVITGAYGIARMTLVAALSASAGEVSFFEGTSYTSKVFKQMNSDAFHGFPEGVRAFEKYGIRSVIKGGDGIERQMLRIPGQYGERSGFFEFIKEADGSINHRVFLPTR